jgi:hypothetical protein
VLDLEKQEIVRHYADELKTLRRMVIELKNKYSAVLEAKATECETDESVRGSRQLEFQSSQKTNLNIKKSRTARKDAFLLDNYMS